MRSRRRTIFQHQAMSVAITAVILALVWVSVWAYAYSASHITQAQDALIRTSFTWLVVMLAIALVAMAVVFAEYKLEKRRENLEKMQSQPRLRETLRNRNKPARMGKCGKRFLY